MSNTPIQVTTDLNQILVQIGNKLDKIDEKFEAKLDKIEAKFEAKFDKIDEKFDKIDEKFDKIDERLNKIEVGQARFEEKIDGLVKRFEFQEFISRGVVLGLIVAILGGLAKLFGLMGNP
jgi:predicted nuclease with TOPRIM domain